jgi:predicted dehydrogenase
LILRSSPVVLTPTLQGNRKTKIAFVGCGGSGTGAASQALAAGSGIELVALADIFEDKVN